MKDPLDLLSYPMPRTCPFDPPPEFSQMRARRPVCRAEIRWNGKPLWLVSRFDDVRMVLSDPRFSADSTIPNFPMVRPQAEAAFKPTGRYPQPLLKQDGASHRRLRRSITKHFTVHRTAQRRELISSYVDDLITEILKEPSRETDLVKSLAMPVPTLFICHLLGVPYDDRVFFHENAMKFLSADSTPSEAFAAKERLIAYLDELLAEKQRSPGDDLISEYITDYVSRGKVTREEAVVVAELLLTAGHETTTNMISLAVLALLQHPAELARLKDDPAIMPDAVEELLRYLSIVHGTTVRIAVQDVEVGGQLIRAGEGVLAALASANRDQTRFTHPDELDFAVSRRNHVTFGFGPHQCLGQPVARLELEIVLGTLFQRIPTLALSVPFEDIRFKYASAIHGIEALPVRW